MIQPRLLFRALVVVALIGTIAAAASRTTAVRLDCPVVPVHVWCDPSDCTVAKCKGPYYCDRLWTWDEYHLIVDIKTDVRDQSAGALRMLGQTASVQMVDTPHVGVLVPTPLPATTTVVSPQTSGEAAISWNSKIGGSDTSFVLWRDTLGLDVTTVTFVPTTPATAPPPSITVLWRGTCVIAKQQLPTMTPTPSASPLVIPVSVPATLKARKKVPSKLMIDFIDPQLARPIIPGDLYVRDRNSDKTESLGEVMFPHHITGPMFRAEVEPHNKGYGLLITAKDPVLIFGNTPEFTAKRAIVDTP